MARDPTRGERGLPSARAAPDPIVIEVKSGGTKAPVSTLDGLVVSELFQRDREAARQRDEGVVYISTASRRLSISVAMGLCLSLPRRLAVHLPDQRTL